VEPEERTSGRLVLAGAPLGNVADASQRLRDGLTSADVVAAEDTRRLRRLATDLGIEVPGRIVSYFEGNERQRTPQLVEALRDGQTVLLITDGGMPSVSDPGYRLVAAAVVDDIKVTVLPGPSAVTTALAVSGLPSDRFCFEGFAPRKPSERRRAFAALADEPRTIVLFEATHRLSDSLADLAAALGADRPAAVCRELTKTYEQVRRGPLGELAEWAADGVRGEITLVIGGAPAVTLAADEASLVAAVAAEQSGGLSRRDAVATVAQRLGVPKRQVYEAALAADRPAP
jgi:16S rRNA (cytidine1402-2'-O)-methyltransferase